MKMDYERWKTWLLLLLLCVLSGALIYNFGSMLSSETPRTIEVAKKQKEKHHWTLGF